MTRASIPLESGWKWYVEEVPPRDVLVRFSNEYNGKQWTGYARELHPEFNVAHLLWKLTGIARTHAGD
jgi:hypothetical protein